MNRPKIWEFYTHYKKWWRYEIVCIGKMKETKEDVVAYRALYPVTDLGEEFSEDPVFMRKLEDFCHIFPDGTSRFQKID